MDGRILLPHRGDFYLLFGDDNLTKDQLSKTEIKSNNNKKKDKKK